MLLAIEIGGTENFALTNSVPLYTGGDRGSRTLLDSPLARRTRNPLLPPEKINENYRKTMPLL